MGTGYPKDSPLKACDDCGKTVLKIYLKDDACPECRLN